jgi:hypothetical protein
MLLNWLFGSVLLVRFATGLYDCGAFTVVPGSLYNVAYKSSGGGLWTGAAVDFNYCKTSIHPNATLPIVRDDLTKQYIQLVNQWSWLGLLYSTATSSWTWVDGVTIAARQIDFINGNNQSFNNVSCVLLGADGFVYRTNCSTANKYNCEINGNFAF